MCCYYNVDYNISFNVCGGISTFQVIEFKFSENRLNLSVLTPQRFHRLLQVINGAMMHKVYKKQTNEHKIS